MAKAKKGKYVEVVAGLSPLPPDDPTHQQKIDAIKKELTKDEQHTPESLAKGYQLARFGTTGSDIQVLGDEFISQMIELLGQDGLEDLAKIASRKVEAWEQLLAESYDHEEYGWGTYGGSENMVRLVSGESVQVQQEPYGRVEDKEKFRLWCVANGLEQSLQLWPSTMQALTKERLLAGESCPEGVAAYVRPKIVWRKG